MNLLCSPWPNVLGLTRGRYNFNRRFWKISFLQYRTAKILLDVIVTQIGDTAVYICTKKSTGNPYKTGSCINVQGPGEIPRRGTCVSEKIDRRLFTRIRTYAGSLHKYLCKLPMINHNIWVGVLCHCNLSVEFAYIRTL